MPDRTYKFADFELISATSELRIGNRTVRLQEKPLLLLCILLDHPGSLVTRDQLREQMWGGDTFVDYEQGINVAIRKVRSALGDSAENPRFIETLAKKGYRFLLPVEINSPEVDASQVAEPATLKATALLTYSVRRGFVFAVLATVVLLTIALWFLYTRYPRPTKVRSLAVLPLRNLSPDPGEDYFADGITEDVITDLAQSLPVRVISRTSVMRYIDSKEPITQIARELGVEVIVEGAVTRAGNRVAVTVQLIDATQDRHLWAQKYDRDVGDLLLMEAELSHEIASRVGGALGAQRMADIAKPRPVDPHVYDLCLLGRYHWNKRTAADLAKSADYYQKAIDRDPTYAPAFAGLASALVLMPSYDRVRIQDTYTRAAAAARHALELDDTLAEAHAALGLIALNSLPDREHAEAELRRALELNPNYATAHHWFSFYLFYTDRNDEAFAELERARQLDPLSGIINADEGAFLYSERRFEQAKTLLRKAVDLEPSFGQPHMTLSFVHLETGHEPNALKEARTALVLNPNDPATIGGAGYVLAATGHTEEARKMLANLKDMTNRGSALPLYEALIYMGLGERSTAIDALGGMLNPEISGGTWNLSHIHQFDDLHGDPRFQKLIAREKNLSKLDSVAH